MEGQQVRSCDHLRVNACCPFAHHMSQLGEFDFCWLCLQLSQVIVLSKVLAHEVNIGYHSVGCGILKSFNGREVPNLRALAKAVDDVSHVVSQRVLRPSG